MVSQCLQKVFQKLLLLSCVRSDISQISYVSGKISYEAELFSCPIYQQKPQHFVGMKKSLLPHSFTHAFVAVPLTQCNLGTVVEKKWNVWLEDFIFIF